MSNICRQAVAYAWAVIPDEKLEAWTAAYKRLPKDKRTWTAAYRKIPPELLTTDSVTFRRLCLAWDIVKRAEGGDGHG